MNALRILGLDTSGKVASAAILDTEADLLLAERSLYTTRGHSQIMMPMVEHLLSDCGMKPEDVDCYAVAVGPGSYTGLRIGIAAVQGMAMVHNTPCIGVSTLEAMASRICGETAILSIMHARADLFYAALFQGKRLTPDKLMTASELTELAAAYEMLLLVGDGAAEFCRQYQGNCELTVAPAHLRLQSAAGVCAAAERKTPGSPETLTASYLQAVNITRKQ